MTDYQSIAALRFWLGADAEAAFAEYQTAEQKAYEAGTLIVLDEDEE